MTLLKSYVTEDQNTTVQCSLCSRSRRLNVSGFLNANSLVRLKANCLCGNSFETILERRKHYRKLTNLPGSYESCSVVNADSKGLLTISDLSKTGMKLKIAGTKDISRGDILMVQFHLDDAVRSLLNKMVIVKNLRDPYVGTEFAPTESICKALGFYLLS